VRKGFSKEINFKTNRKNIYTVKKPLSVFAKIGLKLISQCQFAIFLKLAATIYNEKSEKQILIVKYLLCK
jgi:hypothetical protein